MQQSVPSTADTNSAHHPCPCPPIKLAVGSRQSQLAMTQTELVVALLHQAHTNAVHIPQLQLSVHGISTTGDKVLDVALSKIGSKSLFTKELEAALHTKHVDLVVHSLKDVPTALPLGMDIGAILHREDPRDAVVMAFKLKERGIASLEQLPGGSVVGTSSLRRIAQLKRKFPGLVFQDVRGNLNTRLAKLDAQDSPFSCLILAYAGLVRLGWHSRISSVLPPEVMLYAVGQGALAIEIRADDKTTRSVVQVLDHQPTRICVSAERSFMRYLEGGCSVPLGVWSELVDTDDASHDTHSNKKRQRLTLVGSVTSLDGAEEFKETAFRYITPSDSTSLQISQAEDLGIRLARKLEGLGVHRILDDIKKDRENIEPANTAPSKSI
ncbi:hydroxymethylbilane synthase [Synchytrium endobioticum]|uniref:hydroxymethylbilane synthase n=1 Tax=Synchytrium endobioticum TaxID=286115 RepID=A0A507CPL7_9FUNG|nr:hydroxymethylbilane synthase [Synchytrium endobioticum]